MKPGTTSASSRRRASRRRRRSSGSFSGVDQFLTHRLAVYDRDGTRVLEMTRPAKIFKSTLQIADDQGRAAGRIMQENVVGMKRFRLEGADGRLLGSINA